MFSRFLNPKKVFFRGPVCLPGWLKTPGKPSISHQTCANRLESCITWWYMFPSARRKFEPESKLILTFWYFEDVISKWRKSLKYRIPLTRIRPPQSRSHLILTFWSTSNRLLIEAEVSWSTVYYTSDFSEIWKWHLQNTKMSKSTSITMWWWLYMIPCARQDFDPILTTTEGGGVGGQKIFFWLSRQIIQF